jgi:hypothetical protein
MPVMQERIITKSRYGIMAGLNTKFLVLPPNKAFQPTIVLHAAEALFLPHPS